MAVAQNPFDQKKQSILDEINSTDLDLSPKGTIDELCLPLMALINSHKDMVTTSSCSGRLSVFAEGNKALDNDTVKVGGKGEGGKWLYVTHDKNQIMGWLSKVEDYTIRTDDASERNQIVSSNRLLLYKYEPFILHVKCRDFETAALLYNVAMSCGFRESGIGSNNIVAIRINIKLDVPIGFVDKNLTETYNLIVGKSYINILDQMTVIKFEENKQKMDKLYKKIESEIINSEALKSKSKKNVETKEEKRERKIREGLERQRLAREKKESSA